MKVDTREILHVVGARPNFMKMAPVHRALGANVLEPNAACGLLQQARQLIAGHYPPAGKNPVLLQAKWDGKAGVRVAEALVERSTWNGR